MKRASACCLIILAMTAFLSVCLPAGAAETAGETVRIAGTGTALGTMKLLAAAFEKGHPGIRVVVLPSVGSSGGIRAAAKGVIDIGVISRALKEGEKGLGVSVTDYAETPFVLVTRENIPAAGLSMEDVVRIFRGTLQIWPDGERIRLITRPASETDTLMARTLSPAMSAAMDAALSREGMLKALTDQDCVNMAERTPGAVAFSTLTQVIAEKHKLKVLMLDGMNPERAVHDRAAYPYYKKLSLVMRRDASPAARQFLEFIRSAKGRKILIQSGNRPLGRGSGR